MLRGLERFRIVEEDSAKTYRRAAIEPLIERPLETDDRQAVSRALERLLQLALAALLRERRDFL